MATEQKCITVPHVSFDLEQPLDIIRQLDEPARLQIAEVLTETLADARQSAEPHQNVTHLNLNWRGSLSDVPNQPTEEVLNNIP